MKPCPVRSIADLAENLMSEFETQLTDATVTEVVMDLSQDGFISLDDLADAARRQLESLAGERPEAGHAGGGGQESTRSFEAPAVPLEG